MLLERTLKGASTMKNQKTVRTFLCLLVCAVVSLALTLPPAALAVEKKGGGGVALMKPDLYILSFRAERIGLTDGGSHRVQLTVQVRCAGNFAGSCGAFKIRTEGTEFGGFNPPFFLIGESGVASLGTGFGSAALPTETRTFEQTVLPGRTMRFVAIVDSGNMVDEANETNNRSEITYTATGCEGSDLELTQVEMIRSGSGVVFHVWVRNRCLAACIGDLYYQVTPVIPAGGGVEQGIGGRINGETSAGPLGNVLIGGRAATDLTYDVSVGVRGGTCRDSSPANNSCRARISATEERKTVTCAH
jgi:hypothetical protein